MDEVIVKLDENSELLQSETVLYTRATSCAGGHRLGHSLLGGPAAGAASLAREKSPRYARLRTSQSSTNIFLSFRWLIYPLALTSPSIRPALRLGYSIPPLSPENYLTEQTPQPSPPM